MGGMTAAQAGWASNHDWFIRSEREGRFMYKVVARDVLVDEDGRVHESVVEFTSYSEMRAWAGY